MSVLDCLGN